MNKGKPFTQLKKIKRHVLVSAISLLGLAMVISLPMFAASLKQEE